MKKEKNKKTCACDEKCECGCNEGKTCTCEDEKCNRKECSCDECSCENCECEECSCDDCNCDECNCEDIVNEINGLNKTISELEQKLKDAEQNILKEKAETINYRKRKDEEVGKMLKYCNEDLVEEILPTLDNFERAIALDDADLTDELSKFLSGFKMIYCHLVNALEKYGVKAIDGFDKPFDPTYHNAVMTEKVEGVKPGMVVEVLQKGYLLKDKVIRTAMVKVSE